MSTKWVYFTGVTKWAKVRKPDEKYDNFQVPLYLDAKNEELFDSLELRLTKKEDADGKYVTFKRPNVKLIKKEMVEFGPPKVFDKNNQEWDGLIGNGSTVTVKVAVYDTQKGKGHRLESVRVEDLVEYNAPSPEEAATRPALPF